MEQVWSGLHHRSQGRQVGIEPLAGGAMVGDGRAQRLGSKVNHGDDQILLRREVVMQC